MDKMQLQEPTSGLTPHLAIGGGKAAPGNRASTKRHFDAEWGIRHTADDSRLMHAHLVGQRPFADDARPVSPNLTHPSNPYTGRISVLDLQVSDPDDLWWNRTVRGQHGYHESRR